MYIGIDIGGTNARIASYKTDGKNLILVSRDSFLVDKRYETSLETIVQNIKKIINSNTILGLGIGVPGSVDSKKEVIDILTNLPTWNYKPIVSDLRKEFDLPIKLDSDSVLAALGEATYGAGRSYPRFFYGTWGTGIGGTLVETINKQKHLIMMEYGNQILFPEGRQCTCGQKGCLEAYAGGWAVEKYDQITLAKANDKKWSELANYMALSTVNVIALTNIPVVIYGGGVVDKQPHIVSKIKNALKKHLKVYPMPKVKRAELGDDSGLYGAVAQFFTETI